jgi:malate/lactate dehydrogenase
VIEARKLSSAMSAAQAVSDHMRDWSLGTPADEIVSMAVVSKGEYGTEKGLWFSFPVQCASGNWRIVPGLSIDDFSQKMLKTTEQELIDERKMALNI